MNEYRIRSKDSALTMDFQLINLEEIRGVRKSLFGMCRIINIAGKDHQMLLKIIVKSRAQVSTNEILAVPVISPHMRLQRK